MKILLIALVLLCGLGRCVFAEEPQKVEEKTELQKKRDKTRALLEEISKAVEEYDDIEFEGTDITIRENRTAALKKLTKKFEGREISVVFPIENVSKHFSEGETYRSGMEATITLFTFQYGSGSGSGRDVRRQFHLDLVKSTVRIRNQEGQSVEVKPVRPMDGYYIPSIYTVHLGDANLPVDSPLKALTMKIAKENALKIDDKWTLEISGKTRLSGDSYEGKRKTTRRH